MKTTKSKSGERLEFGCSIKVTAFAGLLSIVSGCGDGQPDPGELTRSRQLKAQILTDQTKESAPAEVFPLASDFLRQSNSQFRTSEDIRSLSEFNFSSALGDLPEAVGDLSEGLGLVADDDQNGLRTVFG
ncbi:hypothetical protein EBR21_01945, partial [bacterium]|nr:hypothetical protein [bacterium]